MSLRRIRASRQVAEQFWPFLRHLLEFCGIFVVRSLMQYCSSNRVVRQYGYAMG